MQNLISSPSEPSSVVNQVTTLTGEPLGQSYIPDVQPKWQSSPQVISGNLMWVSDKGVCRAIAIKADDEKPGADGTPPLRGIVLNRDATVEFDKHYGSTLFWGERIAVLVGSQESLDKDLADGKGLKGNAYLKGFDFTYRQPKLGNHR